MFVFFVFQLAGLLYLKYHLLGHNPDSVFAVGLGQTFISPFDHHRLLPYSLQTLYSLLTVKKSKFVSGLHEASKTFSALASTRHLLPVAAPTSCQNVSKLSGLW